MKRFQFTLDSILELRLEEEQEAEVRLGRAMGEWNALNEKKMNRLAVKDKFSRGPSSADLLQNGLYIARIDQEIARFQQDMDSRNEELERLREEYRAARARREGLDMLKDKRRDEYKEIRKRVEAHGLDDLLNNMNRLKKAGD